MFRNLVIGFHNTKASAIDDIDNYLEKELLDKKGKKPAGRIDAKSAA